MTNEVLARRFERRKAALLKESPENARERCAGGGGGGASGQPGSGSREFAPSPPPNVAGMQIAR